VTDDSVNFTLIQTLISAIDFICSKNIKKPKGI